MAGSDEFVKVIDKTAFKNLIEKFLRLSEAKR